MWLFEGICTGFHVHEVSMRSQWQCLERRVLWLFDGICTGFRVREVSMRNDEIGLERSAQTAARYTLHKSKAGAFGVNDRIT